MISRSVKTPKQTEDALGPAERNLAFLAHELQTPLGGIRGLMGLMADGSLGPLNPRQRAVVDLVRRNVSHLECLTAEFLDFAAIETGTLRLRPRPFRPEDAMEEVVALLRPDADARGIYLDARVRPKGVVVVLDSTRFREVLFNLLGNALRHSPDGGRVEVRVNVDDSGLCLAVGDEGAGIDAAIRENLFQPFEGQGEGGHGLGLSLVQGIVHAQGGRIAVHEGSPGTVFRVQLPISLAESFSSSSAGTQAT